MHRIIYIAYIYKKIILKLETRIKPIHLYLAVVRERHKTTAQANRYTGFFFVRTVHF